MWQFCKAMVNNSLIQVPWPFRSSLPAFLTRRLAQIKRAVTAIWLGDGHLAMASIWNNRPKSQLIPKIRLLPGETPKGVVPSNLDRGEETCLESAVDLLIPRPS